MSTVIKVENLFKKYIIGHQQQERYLTLRDTMTKKFKEAGKRLLHPFLSSSGQPLMGGANTEEFWALKDVSFEVNQGDRIGIIGRNGAGKSTLLKILSRITEPTTGKVRIKGRVASLLEVGTGFHPELTGRENIFLNGAILGMGKEEIKKKFDEIVAFAEVEKFLDTPVKRYSSGMYVRLAFAVAAHLEPEILIVDEVLSVGDAQFQKKCLGKMEDVSTKEGRTVLFVSHNMEAVSVLCNKGILLDSGRISYSGEVKKTVTYYNEGYDEKVLSVENCSRHGGSGGIKINKLWVTNFQNEKINCIARNEGIILNLEAKVNSEYQNKESLVVGFGIDTIEGRRLLTCVSSWESKNIVAYSDKLKIKCLINNLPLVPGKYLISSGISYLNDTLDYVEHCYKFEIIQDNDISFSLGRNARHGYLNVPYSFEVTDVQETE